MNYQDMRKQSTRCAHYRVNISWHSLRSQILKHTEKDGLCPLNMNPSFQRGHVWTTAQQIAYVEFKLKGGEGSNLIFFNCKGWMNNFEGPFVLVDGKQRICAVLRFLKGQIPAFGVKCSEFEGYMPNDVDFVFAINDLKTEKEVLKWYLEMNSGGTPHTQDELNVVKAMLEDK